MQILNLLIISLSYALSTAAFAHGDRWEHCLKKTGATSSKLSYARGFKIAFGKSVTVIKGAKVFTIGKTKTSPCKKVQHLQTPVEAVALTSGPHITFLSLIKKKKRIQSYSQGKYIFDVEVKKRYQADAIVELNSPISMEKLFKGKPDIIFTSFGELSHAQKRKLSEQGIISISVHEYKEASSLGRAEWIKFFGAIFDENKKADQVFKKIEKDYLDVVRKLKDVKFRPNVLVGSNFKGRWAAPGSNSDFANIIRDAGGNYIWKNEGTKNRLQIPFEKVLKDSQIATVWLTQTNDKKISDILKQDQRYEQITALNNKNVYTFSKQINKDGANDYWERGVVRPDLVIKDLARILQPLKFNKHKLIWYQRLQ